MPQLLLEREALRIAGLLLITDGSRMNGSLNAASRREIALFSRFFWLESERR
jgi:hypothetical protein